jgi:hypothetical protein
MKTGAREYMIECPCEITGPLTERVEKETEG